MAKRIILGVLGAWVVALSTGCVSTSIVLHEPAPIVFEPNLSTAMRIRQVAYGEHQAWHGSFIDVAGGIRRYEVGEAERTKLTDGGSAWERVMLYWQDSGGITELSNHQNCLMGRSDVNRCRAFVLDSAWSAVFVSYVMKKAGVVGFRGSPRHFDYIKDAYDGKSPYRYTNPATTTVSVGDMLCYVRGKNMVAGFDGLSDYLKTQDKWLTAHCDIVVDVHDDEVWLIGGNVQNTVMLRQLPLYQSKLQLATGYDECRHDNKSACNLNRQNWAVLLKLQQ